jgi:hypothetical protein
MPALAAAPEPPCPRGWFGVQAIVTRINPANADVRLRSARGNSSVLGVNMTLCEGDTILFPNGSDGTVVELYKTGEMVQAEASKGPYTIKGGTREASRAARAYLDAALDAVFNLGAPPPRPNPTASRGNGASAAAAAEPIRTILHLRNLPRQRITADTHPVVGWRGGIAPYACQALNEGAEVTWAQADLGVGWCEFGAGLDHAARLVVRDAAGRSAGWNVAVVAWPNVPRPEWVPRNMSDLSSADMTAWAIWIWQTAGPEWRLQSLGMLNRVGRTEWLANYFVDSVLAEMPPLRPR